MAFEQWTSALQIPLAILIKMIQHILFKMNVGGYEVCE